VRFVFDEKSGKRRHGFIRVEKVEELKKGALFVCCCRRACLWFRGSVGCCVYCSVIYTFHSILAVTLLPLLTRSRRRMHACLSHSVSSKSIIHPHTKHKAEKTKSKCLIYVADFWACKAGWMFVQDWVRPKQRKTTNI